MKLNLDLKNLDFIKLTAPLKTALPEILKKKAEIKERLRKERQCTGITKRGARCQAWSVVGDPDNVCFRHGGAKTLVIPKSERYPACTCGAYNFPHRQRSGLCLYPEKPIKRHPTPAGQRRYYKRKRKERVKKWLKSLGL